jgi:hypothetical protein
MLPELVHNGYIGIHGGTSAKIGSVNVDFPRRRNITAPRANPQGCGQMLRILFRYALDRAPRRQGERFYQLGLHAKAKPWDGERVGGDVESSSETAWRAMQRRILLHTPEFRQYTEIQGHRGQIAPIVV